MELRNCDNFKFNDVEIFAFSTASGTIGLEFDVLVTLLNSDTLIGSVSEENDPGDCCALKFALRDEKEILPEE
jgi:hypothetical protein